MLSVKDYSDLQKSRGMSAVWDEGGQKYVDICKEKNIVVCEVVVPDEDGWNEWLYTVFKNGYERALLAYKGDLTYIIDDIKDTTCYQEDIDNSELRSKRFVEEIHQYRKYGEDYFGKEAMDQITDEQIVDADSFVKKNSKQPEDNKELFYNYMVKHFMQKGNDDTDAKSGFTFRLGQKEVFIETSAKRRTQSLASKILRKLLLPDNPSQRKELIYYLEKADLDERLTKKGDVYYKFIGDNFSSTCFADDIIIIKV